MQGSMSQIESPEQRKARRKKFVLQTTKKAVHAGGAAYAIRLAADPKHHAAEKALKSAKWDAISHDTRPIGNTRPAIGAAMAGERVVAKTHALAGAASRKVGGTRPAIAAGMAYAKAAPAVSKGINHGVHFASGHKMAVGLGAAAVVGGGAYAVHRHNVKKQREAGAMGYRGGFHRGGRI